MTNSRLLLINPPFPRKVAGVPLQMLYLAAAAKGIGVETHILDLDIEEESQRASILERILQDYKPTHAGVTSYSPNYPESLEIMRIVKEVNPSIVTISGGPHEIAMGNFGEKPDFIDYRVTSVYGEKALGFILGRNIKVDRNTLFPAFELLKDSPQYQFDAGLFEGRKMTQILSAVGCNQGCDFCSAQIEYKPFTKNAVVAQLEKLIDLGYRAVFFNDPNFTNPSEGPNGEDNVKAAGLGNYTRTLNLMDAIEKSGLPEGLAWGCQTKASMVNPQVLDAMRRAGCAYIAFALETADDSVLRAMHKGVSMLDVRNAINLCRERGIKTGLYVMLGNHPDNEIDFQNTATTLDFVEELEPNYLSISILANYPMIDRQKSKKEPYKNLPEHLFPRKHMKLDYANKKYNREPIWLHFDEGWGAYHPNTDVEQAMRYKQEIDRRMAVKPEIWSKIKRF